MTKATLGEMGLDPLNKDPLASRSYSKQGHSTTKLMHNLIRED